MNDKYFGKMSTQKFNKFKNMVSDELAKKGYNNGVNMTINYSGDKISYNMVQEGNFAIVVSSIYNTIVFRYNLDFFDENVKMATEDFIYLQEK